MEFFLRNFLLSLLLSIGSIFNCTSQQWQTVGGGTDNDIRNMYIDTVQNKIYIVGNFYFVNGMSTDKVAVWDGVNWGSLNDLSAFNSGPIFDITKYNNEIIVSGSQYLMEDVLTGSLAKLTTNGWQPFNNNIDENVALMEVIDDELYLTCCFDSINSLPIKNIAKWNGIYWDSIGNQSVWPDGSSSTQISTITKYHNNLIAGGNFNGNGLKEIAQFDGISWLPLSAGVLGEAWVNKVIVYKDILYVGGYFSKMENGNPSSYLMAWNGEQWFNPFPNVEYDWQIGDMNIIENELYIVGNFKFIDDNKKFTFGKYDGENFCAFGGSCNLDEYPDPQKIGGLNGEIFVICNKILLNDTVNHIAKWIGTEMDSCIYSPITVSLPEKSSEIGFKMYPNPTKDFVKLNFENEPLENEEVVIFDQIGKEVLRKKIAPKINNNDFELDLGDLKNGVYFITMKSKDRYTTLKLVKL